MTKTAVATRPNIALFGAMVLTAALLLTTAQARAQETIVAHGISTFGALKYPADFKHLDYLYSECLKPKLV